MSKKTNTRIQYPTTRLCDQVDDYHGTLVADPYRWLEDPNADETADWVTQQNAVTDAILEGIPQRDRIKERLTQLWDYEKFSSPSKKAGKIFYSYNSGLQNQYVLYVIDHEGAEPRVLIDPNTFSEDGTVALTGTRLNEDATLIAYGISHSGSDWQEWKVRDVATGEDLDDHIKWVKFSGASWTKDGRGFFYSRYDEPNDDTKHEDVNYNQKLFYHEIGTDQSEDVLIYERPDHKEWGFGGYVTEDGKYLIISVWHGTAPENRVFYKDLEATDNEVVELLPDADASYSFVGNDGERFWFFTDRKAPKGKLVEVDIVKAIQGDLEFKDIIPENKNTLEGVGVVGERFFAHYLEHAQTKIVEVAFDGSIIRDVKLPGIGSAGGFGGKREDMETFYTFSTYNSPPVIYQYDIETGESSVHFKPDIDFDGSKYVTKQVFVTSKDGTQVPMFITYKKGLKRNRNNATYLYGYGGFNISLGPGFSTSIAVWMEMGGIFAEACLRGGGEYGEDWHQAGTKLNKQNVFDDFIACGEWLIENDYTSTEKLAIGGGSNGGLLAGACAVQRPDLFAVTCPAVGVLDMLRFHKFTIGWAWTSDYGSSENEDEFHALYAYSPVHNVVDGTRYPSMWVTTADHDDRVVPAHSYKFISRVQAAHSGDNPVVIQIETKAGHGSGKPTSKIIQSAADKWGFLVQELKIPNRKVNQLQTS